MAHHKDAIKRHKQSEKRRIANRAYRTKMRNQVKKLRGLIEAGEQEAAQAELKNAASILHRNAGKGVIHKNQAARKLARLAAAVKGMSA